MNIITNQQINVNTTETNQNIIFISSSCYSDYLSSNHLIFINNVVKLNTNRNILFFCGTLQCMKSIQDLQHKLAFANLFVYRLQLQTLANNTPLQSFFNDHPLNRLKRGREFMSDIQKISILLILYKYKGLYIDINYIPKKHIFLNKYFSYNWIHNQSMFIQSHINNSNNGSQFLYEIMSHINLQYSSYNMRLIDNTSTKWPLQMNIDSIINTLYNKYNIVSNTIPISKQIEYNILKDKHYGILSFDSRAKEWHPANAGDETQTFSGLQFIPFVDTFVDRTNWNIDTNNHLQQDNHSIVTFLNAWYGNAMEIWPPMDRIDPLLFSMHFVSDARSIKRKLTKNGLNYFLQYNEKIGAIGARDPDTLQFFKNNNIDAYWSGCATLLLQMGCDFSNEKDDNASILIIDVRNKKAINKIIELIPNEIRHQIKYITQSIGDENIWKNRMARYDYSYNMMKEIAKAKILITSRLHSSLPAVAMNTTVIFVHTPSLPGGHKSRINGFNDLFYNVGINNISETLSLFNWISPSVNPNYDKMVELRERMVVDIKKFNELYENAVTFGVLPFDN